MPPELVIQIIYSSIIQRSQDEKNNQQKFQTLSC